MAVWHYHLNGANKGPVTDDQLKALCDAGVVHAGTMVWRSDLPTWRRLAETDFRYAGLAQQSAPKRVHLGPAPEQLFGRKGSSAAASDTPAELSMWGYFARGVSSYYGAFSGRARRKEYWGYTLFWLLAFMTTLVLGLVIDTVLGNLGWTTAHRDSAPATFILSVLFYIGTIIPGLAVTIRRLHDAGLTGWLVLVWLLPTIGTIVLIVLMCLPTDPNINKHGVPARPVRA